MYMYCISKANHWIIWRLALRHEAFLSGILEHRGGGGNSDNFVVGAPLEVGFVHHMFHGEGEIDKKKIDQQFIGGAGLPQGG